MGFLPLFIKWFTHTLKIYKKILSGKSFVGAEIYYFSMTREDLQKLMLKQVNTRILEITSGVTKEQKLPENVISLEKERFKRIRNQSGRNFKS